MKTDITTETFSTLRLEKDRHIARLTLCRPDLLNRIDGVAHNELMRAFRHLATSDDLRAVVFAAEGKVFSAGGDFDLIQEMHDRPDVRHRTVREGLQLIDALLDVSAPIVVALHGHAMGVGATLVLGCDAIVTHPNCKIADPHVTVGLVAGDGGCLFWPQSVGMQLAKHHLLTGEALTGARAYAIGLVSHLVDDRESVLPRATNLASRLAELPPLAVQGTKRALNAVMRARLAEVLELSLQYESETIQSDDVMEAVSAAREKRPAVYHGR